MSKNLQDSLNYHREIQQQLINENTNGQNNEQISAHQNIITGLQTEILTGATTGNLTPQQIIYLTTLYIDIQPYLNTLLANITVSEVKTALTYLTKFNTANDINVTNAINAITTAVNTNNIQTIQQSIITEYNNFYPTSTNNNLNTFLQEINLSFVDKIAIKASKAQIDTYLSTLPDPNIKLNFDNFVNSLSLF